VGGVCQRGDSGADRATAVGGAARAGAGVAPATSLWNRHVIAAGTAMLDESLVAGRGICCVYEGRTLDGSEMPALAIPARRAYHEAREWQA
jgi:hypothetical protein